MSSAQQTYDCFCVVDFEATCNENADFLSFPHEIIEFPVLVVNIHTKRVEHQFHSFVRPTENPILSDFCKRLTGIEQAQVDAAPTLVEVLKKMFLWLKEIGIFEKRFIFVTHGPCDFGKFLSRQCERVGFHLPRYMRQWIDIKKTFRESRGWGNCVPCGIKDMLSYYRLDFDGNEHSGLEDTKNLARILLQMIEEGICLSANDCLMPKNSPKNSPHSARNSPRTSRSPSLGKQPIIIEHSLYRENLFAYSTPTNSPSKNPYHGKKKRATYDSPMMIKFVEQPQSF